MHTTQEWHQHAGFNMTQAQVSHKKAHHQNDRSRRAHEDTVMDNVSAYNELSASIDQKVKNSQRLLDKLHRRAGSLETSIGSSKQSLQQLEAALRAKEPPLQLCMWRMEQREKRPLREQVRDISEVALESEKQNLIDTQRKLAECIKRTKGTIADLEDKLQEVRHDIDQKKQALSIDEMVQRNTQRSFQTVLDRTPPPERSGGMSPMGGTYRSSANNAPMHESSRNEINRHKEADRLNLSAGDREDVAKAMREDAAKLVAKCQKQADDASRKTERAMQERVNENQQVRRRLEEEVKETIAKIEHTKVTMSETRYQMKALEEPMDLTATCASWRKQRATKEHITDPVSTKLQEHQMFVVRAHQDLKGHHATEKTNLHDLKERLQHLKDDLRDKTASLHIDLNCLTHEGNYINGKATNTLSKEKYHRAMRLDRSFVPGASGTPGLPLTTRYPLSAR